MVPQDSARLHIVEATIDVLRPFFKDRIISHRAAKDKCYVDKSEIIDVLKNNIREAIGEIQLLTIDNVVKN